MSACSQCSPGPVQQLRRTVRHDERKVETPRADQLTAAMGGAYGFVKNASANLREKDDTWNTTYGGMAAGAVLGLRGTVG